MPSRYIGSLLTSTIRALRPEFPADMCASSRRCGQWSSSARQAKMSGITSVGAQALAQTILHPAPCRKRKRDYQFSAHAASDCYIATTRIGHGWSIPGADCQAAPGLAAEEPACLGPHEGGQVPLEPDEISALL